MSFSKLPPKSVYMNSFAVTTLNRKINSSTHGIIVVKTNKGIHTVTVDDRYT